MKKALKLTLAVALMMGATSLYAQKFGRINSQEIVMAMPETKEMQTNLETFGKELNENIETINVEFNNKLQEYQKTANTLTDAVREMKAKELEDLQRRSQEFQQMAQRDRLRRDAVHFQYARGGRRAVAGDGQQGVTRRDAPRSVRRGEQFGGEVAVELLGRAVVRLRLGGGDFALDAQTYLVKLPVAEPC